MGTDQVPHGRFRRVAPLAALTARTVCGRVVAGLRETRGAEGAVAQFDQHAAQRYMELLGHSRGVLMKAGQILSMCDTQDWGGGGFGCYVDALSRVHTAVPVMTPALVGALLSAELPSGRAGFAMLDLEPVAAASIGQVHRGRWRDGREVAVKVQFPGVARAIEDDLKNAELVATFLRFAAAATGMRADLSAVAEEIAKRIRDEVDYRREAVTLTRFGDLYRGHPFIRIPDVIPEASAERVLTMTYLGGVDYQEALRADRELKNSWAEAITRFVATNIQLGGLLHADPHPGNYRFFPDGTIGCLDFGCIQVLTDQQRLSWVAMVRAVVEGRKDDLRDRMAAVGLLDADPTLTNEDLYQWASTLLYDTIVAPQPVTYTQESRRRAVRSLMDFRDRHHPLTRISFPSEIAFMSRIQLNLVSICAGLEATLPMRAIANDIHGLSEPVTALGREHHAWLRQRTETPSQ